MKRSASYTPSSSNEPTKGFKNIIIYCNNQVKTNYYNCTSNTKTTDQYVGKNIGQVGSTSFVWGHHTES